jgi:uncharacterized membrane protein
MRQFFRPGRLLNLFFQGLIVLAPIVITTWTVVSLFKFIDGILPNLLYTLFPNFVKLDAMGYPKQLPGLGFLVVILLVFVVGYISSLFIVSKLMEWFDGILEKTPGIKIFYTTVKDFMEAFAGNKKKFNKAVLVSIDAEDIWRIGFITQNDALAFGLTDFVAVYVPHSYAFSGVLYFVKRERIKQVDGVSSTDAMKFTISGGVSEIGEQTAVGDKKHAKK